MQTAEQEYRSISSVVDAISHGKTTAKAVTQQYLDAIGELNPEINCYITINEKALEQVETLDVGAPYHQLVQAYRLQSLPSSKRGPLFGVAIAVKDQIETKSIRTTFGSKACENYVPAQDATVVRKLREAGAIILGKTTMPDWAIEGMPGRPTEYLWCVVAFG
ncbi:hypothetical protein NM208_g3878 [Fusarium decemcellulare]|uniref:Uncharacterized protein n=1 Tax=Fusarium decemcellulare TaxID=57161 RepID=A0ACC1SMP2_9HYPO|nr:hypothetical protein NM208_g3878 [Fusarium decemcellulare]